MINIVGYPAFVSGLGIIYSNKFVHDAYRRTLTARFYWVDDVYMSGFIRQEMLEKITPLNSRNLYNNIFNIMNGNLSTLPQPEFLFSSSEQSESMLRTWWIRMNNYRNEQRAFKTDFNFT